MPDPSPSRSVSSLFIGVPSVSRLGRRGKSSGGRVTGINNIESVARLIIKKIARIFGSILAER